MIDFFEIRIFAAEYFYSLDEGVDFEWLKKEWHKFEPSSFNKAQAEDFILSLAYLYSTYYFEAYTLKCCESFQTVQQHLELFKIENTEFKDRIEKSMDFTLKILLDIYKSPEEVNREFASIAIGFQFPHIDGYRYFKELYKETYLPKNNEPNPFF